MNRLLLILFFFLPIDLMAQSMQKTDNHIVFMGIPLDGNYQIFGRKILQKGFKHGYKSYETGELIDNFKKGLYISILYVDDINQTIYDNELNK